MCTGQCSSWYKSEFGIGLPTPLHYQDLNLWPVHLGFVLRLKLLSIRALNSLVVASRATLSSNCYVPLGQCCIRQCYFYNTRIMLALQHVVCSLERALHKIKIFKSRTLFTRDYEIPWSLETTGCSKKVDFFRTAIAFLLDAKTDTKWNIRSILACKQMNINYLQNAVLTILLLLLKKLIAIQRNPLLWDILYFCCLWCIFAWYFFILCALFWFDLT